MNSGLRTSNVEVFEHQAYLDFFFFKGVLLIQDFLFVPAFQIACYVPGCDGSFDAYFVDMHRSLS